MRNRFLAIILLVLAVLAVYWPAHNYGFHWDDEFNLIKNQYLNPVTIDNTLYFWSNSYYRTYTPNIYTVYAFLGFLSQHWSSPTSYLNPNIFHAANITLHIFNALLVFSILRILLSSGFKEQYRKEEADKEVVLAATFGALIFALHPVQVESVVWITSMASTLGGFFSFLCIRWYLAFAFASKEKNEDGRKYFYYTLACAALIMAFLSKPSAVVVPPIVFLLDRWAVKRPFKQIAISLSGWFIATGLFAIVTKSAQQGNSAVLVETPLWAKPLIAGDALTFYLYKLIWPLELGIDYGRSPGYVMEQWWFYASWLVPVSLVAMLFFIKQRTPYFISLGIFVVSFFPVLGFVQFLFQVRSTVADRYFYIPMLGVAFLLSSLVYDNKTKLLRSLFIVAILLFMVRSSVQVKVWKDEMALYVNAIKVNPLSHLTHNNMGSLLINQGEPTMAKLKEAASHFNKALTLKPDYTKARDNLKIAEEGLKKMALLLDPNSHVSHFNMGVALRNRGKLDEAVFHFNKALTIMPGDDKTHYQLGLALEKQKKFDEAITSFQKAINLRPNFADAYFSLGNSLAKKGERDQAISNFQKAITLLPNHARAHNNLGMILVQKEKLSEAVIHYRKSLTIQPDEARVHNNLGVAMDLQGKTGEAVIHYKKALKMRPRMYDTHYNLGLAMKKMGKLDEAAASFAEALKINPSFEFAEKQLETIKAMRVR